MKLRFVDTRIIPRSLTDNLETGQFVSAVIMEYTCIIRIQSDGNLLVVISIGCKLICGWIHCPPIKFIRICKVSRQIPIPVRVSRPRLIVRFCRGGSLNAHLTIISVRQINGNGISSTCSQMPFSIRATGIFLNYNICLTGSYVLRLTSIVKAHRRIFRGWPPLRVPVCALQELKSIRVVAGNSVYLTSNGVYTMAVIV